MDRYRFIIPDLRGHGASDYRGGEMSIEAVDTDLLALIAHEHLEPPHVLAFSFGAEAALDLEPVYPGTSASLILVSPGLGDPKSSVPTREQLESRWPATRARLHAERHGPDHWLELMLELCDRAAVRPRRTSGPSEGLPVRCFWCWVATTTPVVSGKRRSCGTCTTAPKSWSSRAVDTPSTRTTGQRSSPPLTRFSGRSPGSFPGRAAEAWSRRNAVRSSIENDISAEEEPRLTEVRGWLIPRM